MAELQDKLAVALAIPGRLKSPEFIQ
jgi:hypothetical protein